MFSPVPHAGSSLLALSLHFQCALGPCNPTSWNIRARRLKTTFPQLPSHETSGYPTGFANDTHQCHIRKVEGRWQGIGSVDSCEPK